MRWEHGRCHGLGTDALGNGWVGSTDVIMVWAWMHWPMEEFAAWTWRDTDLGDRESGASEGDAAYIYDYQIICCYYYS